MTNLIFVGNDPAVHRTGDSSVLRSNKTHTKRNSDERRGRPQKSRGVNFGTERCGLVLTFLLRFRLSPRFESRHENRLSDFSHGFTVSLRVNAVIFENRTR